MGRSYARAGDEACALMREALVTSGDIIPGHGELLIRLNPLTAPRRTRHSPPSATSSTKPQATTPAPISSCATRSNPTLALHELNLYVRSPGSREVDLFCMDEYFIRAHIYVQSGILTPALSALPAITVRPFPSFW